MNKKELQAELKYHKDLLTHADVTVVELMADLADSREENYRLVQGLALLTRTMSYIAEGLDDGEDDE